MRRTLGAAALILAGCGEAIIERREEAEPAEEIVLQAAATSPVIFVLVVAEAPDPEAASLRGHLVRALDRRLRSIFRDRGACRDPAAACPIDLRTIVVRPSAPPASRILGPPTRPELKWTTPWATEAGLDAYISGLDSILEAAGDGGPFRPLEAADDLVRLLARLRPPRTTTEAALVSEVTGDDPWIELILASPRDDESPLAPAAYLPEAGELGWLATVIAARALDAKPCASDGLHGRLGEWARMTASARLALPCDDQVSFDEALRLDPGNARAHCTAEALPKRDDGRLDCRIWHRLPDDQGCEPTRGWLDPEGDDGLRRPKFEQNEDGRRFRICEMSQHEGDRLEACRTNLECPACGSGYCQTQVPELVADPASCERGDAHPLDLRFTGEVLLGVSELVLRCRPGSGRRSSRQAIWTEREGGRALSGVLQDLHAPPRTGDPARPK